MRGNSVGVAGFPKIRSLRWLGLGMIVAASGSVASAANIYWDGTGTSWNTASDWSTVNNATTPDPAFSPGLFDEAVFNITTVNTAQTVNLDAAHSPLGLVFGSTGTVLIQSGSGTNTLTLGANGITVNAGAGADTISSDVSSGVAQAWTNNASSTFTVSGNISNASSLLTIAGSGNTVLSGILGSGSGGLTKNGTGVLTLGGANTYTGATTVSAGTLVLGNASALGSTAGSTTVSSGATLDLAGQTIGAEPLTISGTGVGGNGALVNSSATPATFAGTITNQSFTVGGSGVITLTGSINGTAALTKIGTGTLTLAGTTDNSGLSLAVNAGTVVLAKTSSHSPNDVHAVGWDAPLLGMVISGGTAQLGGTGGDQIYDSANVTVTSGAFDTNGRNETFATLSLQGTGIGNQGALVNTGFNTFSTITPTNGTVLTGNATIGVTIDSAITLNNAVSGNFALTKVGLGGLVLKGTNSFSGGLTVENGQLQVDTLNNAGTSGPLGNNTSVTLGSSGQTAILDYNGSSTSSNMPFVLTAGGTGEFYITTVGVNLTLNGVISGGGALRAGADGLTLGGSNTFTGDVIIDSVATLQLANAGALNASSPNAVTMNGGTLSLGGNSVTVSGLTSNSSSAVVQDGNAVSATLTVNNSADNPFAGVLQNGSGGGTLALAKSGSGTLTLTGTNTFTGGLTVSSGTLQVPTVNNAGTDGPLGNNTSVTLGIAGQTGTDKPIGTLEYTGGTATSTMSFNIPTSNGAIQVDNASTNLTLSGVISGTFGEFIKSGAGTLTLSGNNTFNSDVIINEGTLQVGSAAAISPSMDIILNASNTTFSLAGNSITVFALSAGGSSDNTVVTQNGSTTPATLTISEVGGGSAYVGVIQDGGAGALSVVLTGGGLEFFDNSNSTFSGGLAVQNFTLGIFAINNASTTGVLGHNSSVSLGASGQTGTIEYMGASASSNMPFTLVSGGTGAFQIDNAAINLTLSGVISGSGALSKTGAGTLTLSGNNSFSGVTTVSAGTVVLDNASALGSTAGGTVVNSGATLDLAGQTIGAEPLTISGTGIGGNGALVNSSATPATFAGTITNQSFTVGGSGVITLTGSINGTAALTKIGTGTLTLSGNNSFSGVTTVSAGTVVLDNASALGSTAGGTVVNSGATLDLAGQTIGAEPLTISGTGVGGNGALVNSSATPATFAGTITNQSFTVGGSGVITLTGSINGTAALTKIGTGTLTLAGTTDNSGLSLAVNAGTVVLAKTSSHSPNDVHAVGWDAPLLGMVISGGTAQLGGTGGDQIYDSANVTVTSGAFDTNGRNETFATLSLQGTGISGAGALVNTAVGSSTITPANGTVLTGNTAIGVTQAVGSLTLNNAVSGNFALTKVGAGTLTLSATNTYTGVTTVNGGKLAVNGSVAGNATVNSGGTLQGTGSIGGLVTVNSGGALSPGNSPGLITLGSLALNAGAQANIELGGTMRGSQYDVIFSFGAVSLNGTLTVSLINGFRPVSGDSFDILDWGTISGTFASLQLPGLTAPFGWNTSQLYMSGTLSVTATLRGDWNRDGLLTAADIPAMLAALTDLNTYASTNSLSPTQLAAIGDFDNSGTVTNRDIQGLLDLVASQGGGSAAAVPEPPTLVLVLLAAAGWSLRRSGPRRKFQQLINA